MSENATNLAEIISAATEDGVWVDGPFEAVVRNATARQGKKPSKADLHDPNDHRIRCKSAYFGGSFLDLQGSRIRIAGKGIKAKTYNGECEISIGDKAGLTVMGDAPAAPAASGAARPDAGAPAGQGRAPGTDRAPEDPVAHFHKEMSKISLLWLHAHQYACDVAVKVGSARPITPEQMQALTSSVFITAKDRGLLERPPAPREADGVGFKKYLVVKPTVDPRIAEEEAKHKAEVAAQEAAAAARKAAEEEAARRKKLGLDEDVPF